MIIDLLNNYSIEKQDRILDTAKRWYAQQYHHTGSKIDLYDEFPDAPYWGEYSEDDFYKWFDRLISFEECNWIEDIDKQFKKQKELFDNDKKWNMLLYNEDIFLKLLVWLDKNNITYCIIKGLLDYTDYLYIKTPQLPVEYYVLFTPDPRYAHLEYAVDNCGWVMYNVATLINNYHMVKVEEAISWIMNNSLGVVHRGYSNDLNLFFELEEDAAATKLRWAEYEI